MCPHKARTLRARTDPRDRRLVAYQCDACRVRVGDWLEPPNAPPRQVRSWLEDEDAQLSLEGT